MGPVSLLAVLVVLSVVARPLLAANPAPSVITAAIWRFWVEFDDDEPSVLLGGVYADKSGYHNTVNRNKSRWPGNYSIRFFLDLMRGPKDKARAIDLTMSASLMKKYTARLVAAADRNDPRLRGMREFYGTTNGSTVVGRIRDNDSDRYRSSTSDKTHLWHIHISFWAAYCDSWTVLKGVLDVMLGHDEPEMAVSVPSGSPILRIGSTGTAVRQLQEVLNFVGISMAVDGDFGPNTESGVKAFQRRAKLAVDGEYGPNTANALQKEVNMTIFQEVWFTDKIPSPSADPNREDNKFWAPSSIIRSNNDHARKGLAEIRSLAAVSKMRDEAILSAVKGKASTSEILGRIDEHQQHMELELQAMAAEQETRDSELMDLVRQAQSGALDAAEVVRLIGERLQAPVGTVHE